MKVEIAEAPAAALGAYAAIPSVFEVREVLDVGSAFELSDTSLTRVRTLALPAVKNYDASQDNGPLYWPKRFDLTNWGLLLARSDSEPIGGAAVVFPADAFQVAQDQAVLWDLRVSPAARGQGVGTRLLQHAEDWARRRGARSLGVETQNINVPACRFYLHSGFVLVAAVHGAYPEYPDEVKLWLQKRISTAG
ncbi:MAG: GNAT family N-acetyltransferase [Gemmatimonadaceae bacterium]